MEIRKLILFGCERIEPAIETAAEAEEVEPEETIEETSEEEEEKEWMNWVVLMMICGNYILKEYTGKSSFSMKNIKNQCL
ncbi:unnamed protein product [marine sediment metagenome]|uniref:Uncharacterized protein n=1 Tax=marine sediment metagenome TaxID=412755 RepID=X1K174_9ZZZZ